MKGSMYTSLLPDPQYVGSLDVDAPNLGLMLGAALLAFVVTAVAIPGLLAGLYAVTEGRWIWPVAGLLVWLGAIALAVHLARSYGAQVEQTPFDLLSDLGANVLYTAAILGGLVLGWRARNSLRTYY